MTFLRKPFQIIREHRRAYLWLNLLTYGLFLAGMGAALLFPELTAGNLAAMEADGTADLVGRLFTTPWLFALVILAVNIGTVALLTILLPSMVAPFAGIALFTWKAVTFGISLAPVNPTAATVLIPHTPTIVIELQAYVLVLLGAYLLGKAWVRPASVDAATRGVAYVRGLKQLGWVCLPALVLFIIGAVYEAIELAYIVPRMLLG